MANSPRGRCELDRSVMPGRRGQQRVTVWELLWKGTRRLQLGRLGVQGWQGTYMGLHKRTRVRGEGAQVLPAVSLVVPSERFPMHA